MTDVRTSPSGPLLDVGGSILPLSALFWVDKDTPVPLAEQDGSIAAPTSTVQAGVDVSPAFGAALYIVGLDYSTEDITVADAGKIMSFYGTDATAAIVLNITSASTFRCTQLFANGNLSSEDSIALLNCGVNGTVNTTAGLYLAGDPAFGNTFGIIADAVTVGTALTANRWSFGNTIQSFTLDAHDCTASGAVTITNFASVSHCRFDNSFDSAGLVAIDTAFNDNVTIDGNATLRVCSLGGNLSVSGALDIDNETYLTAIRNGRTITAGTLVVIDATYGFTQKQLGWNPASAANSNVLTVVPAGHTPGLYSIAVSMIVQANATVLTDMNQTIVASGITKSTASSWTAAQFTTGTLPRYAGASTDTGPCTHNVYSDGSSAITVQLLTTGATGTPSIDLYACASFSGQR